MLVQERKRKMYPQQRDKDKWHTLIKIQLANKKSTVLILSKRRLELWHKRSLQVGKGHSQFGLISLSRIRMFQLSILPSKLTITCLDYEWLHYTRKKYCDWKKWT